MFVFDTDHLGIWQRETHPEVVRLAERMADFEPDDFFVTIVSFHEQVTGWNAYLHRAKNQTGVVRAYGMFQGILADFATMNVLPFDDSAAAIFEELRRQRVRVATMDLRIAAITISRGFKLLSRNLADFQKIPGLAVESWV